MATLRRLDSSSPRSSDPSAPARPHPAACSGSGSAFHRSPIDRRKTATASLPCAPASCIRSAHALAVRWECKSPEDGDSGAAGAVRHGVAERLHRKLRSCSTSSRLNPDVVDWNHDACSGPKTVLGDGCCQHTASSTPTPLYGRGGTGSCGTWSRVQ